MQFTVSQLKHLGDVRALDAQGNLVLERSRFVDVAQPMDRKRLERCGTLVLYRRVDVEAECFEYAGRMRPLQFDSHGGHFEAREWLLQLATDAAAQAAA